MRKMSVLSLMLALALTAFAQPAAKGQRTEDLPNPAEIRPEDYRISPEDLQKALHILYGPGPEHLVYPNPAPGAQWYPQAGLGLFMHWGIHSMIGVQPSWNMIKDYEWGGEYHSRSIIPKNTCKRRRTRVLPTPCSPPVTTMDTPFGRRNTASAPNNTCTDATC